MNTAEVSQKTGIAQAKLLKLQREGIITPKATGEGKLRRIDWSEDDLKAAVEHETSEPAKTVAERIIDELGGDAFIAVWIKAQAMRERRCNPAIICTLIGERGARDCLHNDVVGKVFNSVGDVAVVIR